MLISLESFKIFFYYFGFVGNLLKNFWDRSKVWNLFYSQIFLNQV